jgi:hypothetical protein
VVVGAGVVVVVDDVVGLLVVVDVLVVDVVDIGWSVVVVVVELLVDEVVDIGGT